MRGTSRSMHAREARNEGLTSTRNTSVESMAMAITQQSKARACKDVLDLFVHVSAGIARDGVTLYPSSLPHKTDPVEVGQRSAIQPAP
jgi:hypothetical protein